MFQPNDRVVAKYGILNQGFDLTEQIGIVKSVDSYIEVYFPNLQKTFKMLRYELETIDRLTVADLEEIMSE